MQPRTQQNYTQRLATLPPWKCLRMQSEEGKHAVEITAFSPLVLTLASLTRPSLNTDSDGAGLLCSWEAHERDVKAINASCTIVAAMTGDEYWRHVPDFPPPEFAFLQSFSSEASSFPMH